MKLYLIGYRCAGKTTIGKRLAVHLNYDFTDTDRLVEQHTGLSVTEIVKQSGWNRFRQLEKKMLFTTQNCKNMIIATGGGIIIDPENRQFIKENGTCVWLEAELKTILHRLSCDDKTPEIRPSLTQQPLLKENREVLTYRKPLYEQTAHITIDTTGLTPEEIVHMIDRRLS